jgi:hypothetical protein
MEMNLDESKIKNLLKEVFTKEGFDHEYEFWRFS